MAYQAGNILDAVYSVLSNDSTLLALTTELYSGRLPKNATYPCIVVGDTRIPSTPLNVFGVKGRITIFPVTVYDSSRSVNDVVTIAERIDTLLDWRSLTITNNEHIVTAKRDDDLSYDEDNIAAEGMFSARLNYRIETQEEEVFVYDTFVPDGSDSLITSDGDTFKSREVL